MYMLKMFRKYPKLEVHTKSLELKLDSYNFKNLVQIEISEWKGQEYTVLSEKLKPNEAKSETFNHIREGS